MSKSVHNAKKNQNMLKIIVAVGLSLIVFAYAFLTTDNNKVKKEHPKTKIDYSKLLNEEEAVKTKWMGKVSQQVEKSNIHYKQTQKELNELKHQIEILKQQLKKNNKQALDKNITANDDIYKIAHNYKDPLTQLNEIEKLKRKHNHSTYPKYPLPPNKAIKIKKRKKIVFQKELNLLGGDEIVIQNKKDKIEDIKKEKEEIEDFVPTGSIFKVMLLSGFDAPTMSQAKTNPLPILMKVTDLSILPNKAKYDLKECFIIGEGYGDLSSERAYIRTTTLSCVTNSGKIIDTSIKGVVTGEDGKAGLRGRVVSKQGTIIANTIIASFVSNVATAFGNAAKPQTTISPSGIASTPQIDIKQTLKGGAYAGLAGGANKLAEFFLKMADQVSPVIEIDARREVEVILTSTLKLKILDKGNKNGK